MVVIFSTFVFVLSVILIGKSPKAGACLVGGLLVAAPILLLRAARGGLFSTPMGLPFAIIPGTFLFVLVVIVLAKAPKAGAVLIVLWWSWVCSACSSACGYPINRTARSIGSRAPAAAASGVFASRCPSRPRPQPSATPAPIWSPGVDKELDADVYPSKLAAVEAIGPADRQVRAGT